MYVKGRNVREQWLSHLEKNDLEISAMAGLEAVVCALVWSEWHATSRGWRYNMDRLALGRKGLKSDIVDY